MIDFYEFLKTQFSDLESAKKFYHNWIYENHQDIPGHPEWSDDDCFSMRAMAGHISQVLEGKNEQYKNTYMNTKYGSEIYFSLSG